MLLKSGVHIPDFSQSQSQCSEDSLVNLSLDVVSLKEILSHAALSPEDLSSEDLSVVYAVSGYVSKSVSCTCFLPPECIKNTSHFDNVSRGGWEEPQETVLYICIFCSLVFNILLSKSNRSTFFSLVNHRSAFIECTKSLLIQDFSTLANCTHVKKIIFTYFNCLSKNFLKTLNVVDKSSSIRKMSKLLSKKSTV